MAKRTSVKRFKTEEVQGEGSYVVLSSLKVAEVRGLRIRELSDEKDFDAVLEGMKLLAEHVVDWDWVDDDGEPLPQPKGQISVIDQLTNEEAEFLSDLLISGDSKN